MTVTIKPSLTHCDSESDAKERGRISLSRLPLGTLLGEAQVDAVQTEEIISWPRRLNRSLLNASGPWAREKEKGVGVERYQVPVERSTSAMARDQESAQGSWSGMQTRIGA